MPRFIPSLLDLKLGTRMLFKYPGLTFVGGIGMAVAIAMVAGFSSLLFQFTNPTLPIDEGDRLVGLENWDTVINNEERRSIHDFEAWRAEMRTVVDISAFRNAGRNLDVPGGSTEPIVVAEITATGLRTARVAPLLGRAITAEDEAAGAPDVLVLGYGAWQARFAGDPAVVGRVVRLDDVAHTVIGVMPEGFAFPMNHQYWAPFRQTSAGLARLEGPSIFIFGRLAPGVTPAQAQAELTTLGARAAQASPETHARLRATVWPYTWPLIDFQDASMSEVMLQQLIVALLVIVVAANVAVLVYARTASRRPEIAVRTAIGASRGRIVAQLFAEALVLAAVAGVAGLGLAQVGLSLGFGILEQETGTLPFWFKRGLTSELVAATVVLTLLAAAIIGIGPALQATGRRISSGLRPPNTGPGMRLGGTWTVLIVAQVAVATLALPLVMANAWSGAVGAALRQATFPADEFAVVPVAITPRLQAGAVRELMTRLAGEPNVRVVTFADGIPGSESQAEIEIEGQPAGPAVRTARHASVEPGFFAAFGAGLLAGRTFEAADAGSATNPILVNRTFAEQMFGGASPLGRRLHYVSMERSGGRQPTPPEGWYEIVGVVADLHRNRVDAGLNSPVFYHPLAIPGEGTVVVMAHVRGGVVTGMASRFRDLAAGIDPALRVRNVRVIADFDRQERLAFQLVALAIGLVTLSVLLLSAAGVYAMMSFTVSQRRKEIGIRSALGAEPGQVIRSVFGRAAMQLGAGLVVGVTVAALLGTMSGGEILGGRGFIFVPAIALLMVMTGLLAAIGPARRGLRVDATEALKAE